MGRKSEQPPVERIRFHFEEQIIAGRLKPRQRLVEEEIAREMSVSRSQSSGPRESRDTQQRDEPSVALATILGFGPDRPVDRRLQRGMVMLAEEHQIPCRFVSTRSHSACGGAAHVQ